MFSDLHPLQAHQWRGLLRSDAAGGFLNHIVV